MNHNFYLEKFNSAFLSIDQKEFKKSGLEFFTGTVLDSVALKIYKPEWCGDKQNPLTATSRIFFSVWVNDSTINENKLYYNIHAFKLRQLPDYKITSRDFAERFRARFKAQQKNWPNVSVKFGPLTLMQGWTTLSADTLQDDIIMLANNFLTTCPIIDATLGYYKSQ